MLTVCEIQLYKGLSFTKYKYVKRQLTRNIILYLCLIDGTTNRDEL